jgi:pentose-5-phosphate-3-epimerase
MKKSPRWKNNMPIVPALLCRTFEDFRAQLARVEEICELTQIDVMDSVFVPDTSFPDIEKINQVCYNNRYKYQCWEV